MKRRQATARGVALTTAPMESKLVTALPEDAGWQFEPKWDGFRTFEQLAPPARPSRIVRDILQSPNATAMRQGHTAQQARA